MSKHTPGRWRVCSPKLNHMIADENGNTLATIKGSRIASIDEAHRANARLMASAPALLTACTRARDYLSTIPESAAGGDDDAVALCRVLDAAIAVATGETK